FELAQRADGRKHAGTRRCAVVHEYDDALPEAPGRSASAIQSFATRELCLLAGLDAPQCFLAHQSGQVFVPHRDATRGDCADGELGLTWRTERAHDHHIERCRQTSSDLEGNRHAAARQAEDDDVVSRTKCFQTRGELASRGRSVRKAAHRVLPPITTCASREIPMEAGPCRYRGNRSRLAGLGVDEQSGCLLSDRSRGSNDTHIYEWAEGEGDKEPGHRAMAGPGRTRLRIVSARLRLRPSRRRDSPAPA